MKTALVYKAIAVAFGISMLFVGCGESKGDKQTTGIDETQIGLRTAPLESESVNLVDYTFGTKVAGESEKIERSFENAPPLIPHDIEGMLPITQQDNTCLGCHDREIAEGVGATPVPTSHIYDLRTMKQVESGVADARYNCTQCHVPQAQTKPLVENTFSPEFSSESQKHQSNLLDVLNQGVK
nr:nitrate reductase cytochrome c-type subunit [Helicobacter equorum]